MIWLYIEKCFIFKLFSKANIHWNIYVPVWVIIFIHDSWHCRHNYNIYKEKKPTRHSSILGWISAHIEPEYWNYIILKMYNYICNNKRKNIFSHDFWILKKTVWKASIPQ